VAEGLNLDTAQLLALAAALGWASGLRLYAVVFLTGLAGTLGWVTLPAGLQVLQQPAVLWASGAMLVLEFFADKIPVVDSVWDAVHTLIRIPAGAALAAATFGLGTGDPASGALLVGLLGGNTSPEPFSNVGLSLLGDASVPLLLWLSWAHPLAFGFALAAAVMMALALLTLTFKFLRALWRRLSDRRTAAAA
jgi:hypothetical protein